MSKEKNDKKYKYLVTMRWYVETNEELVAVQLKPMKKFSILFNIEQTENQYARHALQDILKVMVSWTTITSWAIKKKYICQLTS